MNRIDNKHGPGMDVGNQVLKRPRDGTLFNPRDGTEMFSRVWREKMPRDKIIMRKGTIPSSKRRTDVCGEPADGTGNGRGTLWSENRILNIEQRILNIELK